MEANCSLVQEGMSHCCRKVSGPPDAQQHSVLPAVHRQHSLQRLQPLRLRRRQHRQAANLAAKLHAWHRNMEGE